MEGQLTEKQANSRADTKTHIARVRTLMRRVIGDLEERARVHDASKLLPPEVEVFDEYTETLKALAYGSPEYKQALAAMKPALDHHYAHNDHHPEFYGERGIHGMGLVQMLEMLVDWKAAGERHGGCIFRSIEMNSKRFKYGDELKGILLNTARQMGYSPEPTVPDEVVVGLDKVAKDTYDCIHNVLFFKHGHLPAEDVTLIFKPFHLHVTMDRHRASTCVEYNGSLPPAVRLATRPSSDEE